MDHFQNELDYVLRTVEERGVKFIQLWFTDVLGSAKGFSITPAELENALSEGMTFDGSSIDGFSRIQESDMLVFPDASTFQILPFTIDGEIIARIFCDIKNIDGKPFEGCPRNVLKHALDSAHERGYSFFAAPEIEYFYFKNHEELNHSSFLDNGSYFDLTISDLANELRKRTVIALEEMGIPVEHAQHEDAPSQHEIDLRYTDALSMADTIMTTRSVIKGIAQGKNVVASFMPKPICGIQGSGMHTHFSLFKEDINVFYSEDDPYQLSDIAKHFIAGLLEHAPAITAVANQWVNSYKRLVPGFEAPTYVTWARNNRSALIRVPPLKQNRIDATRIEFRGADSACNPYLVFALVLAAGLDGIDQKLPLPEEVKENLFYLSDEELQKLGAKRLPKDLDSAVNEMEKSELVLKTLGSHVFEWFIRNKRAEWDEYSRQITPYEINRYFQIL